MCFYIMLYFRKFETLKLWSNAVLRVCQISTTTWAPWVFKMHFDPWGCQERPYRTLTTVMSPSVMFSPPDEPSDESAVECSSLSADVCWS